MDEEKIADIFDRNLELTNVLEVGPGKGAITKYIVKRDYNYKAVEADRDMIDSLLTYRLRSYLK